MGRSKKDYIRIMVIVVFSIVFAVLVNGVDYNSPINEIEASYIGQTTEPSATWECEISCNNSIWWVDRNETIVLDIRSSLLRAEFGNGYVNVSRILLRLYIGEQYIPLFENQYSPHMSIPNITSMSAERVSFETSLAINVSLQNYEFIVSPLRPKVDCNLVFAIDFVNYGGLDRFSSESNYYDFGITGWSPTPIQVIVDRPTIRTWSSTIFLSFFLIPASLYSLSQYTSERKMDIHLFDKLMKDQWLSYFVALSFFSIFH